MLQAVLAMWMRMHPKDRLLYSCTCIPRALAPHKWQPASCTQHSTHLWVVVLVLGAARPRQPLLHHQLAAPARHQLRQN